MKIGALKRGMAQLALCLCVAVLASMFCMPMVAAAANTQGGQPIAQGSIDAGLSMSLTLGQDEDKSTQSATASYRYARLMKDGYLYTTDSKGSVKGSSYWGAYSNELQNNLKSVDVLFIDANVQELNWGKVKVWTQYSWSGNRSEIKVNDGASQPRMRNFSKVVFKLNSAGASSVRTINGYFFGACENLKTVENYDKTKVNAVSDQQFTQCKSLQSIKLPPTCVTIGVLAFKDCMRLTSVSFNKVESIERQAFEGCGSLASIDLPKTLRSIERNAFYNCTSLTKVTMRSTTQVNLSGLAFTYAPVGTKGNSHYFYVPSSLLSKYRSDSRSANDWYEYRTKFGPISGAKTSIAGATVTGISNKTYTGKAITPKPIVKIGSKTLKEGTDYTVSYKNNVKVGTASLTITGKSGYTGTITKTFKITKASQSTAKKASWTRLAGMDALGTMQAVVAEGWRSSNSVVLATSNGYWDALSAASLAGKLKCPVLLTRKSGLSPYTARTIKDLNARTVYIVGGTAAVSKQVERDLKNIYCVRSVKRLAGANAQGTANAISKELGKSATGWGVVATSNGYWDALAASPYAYAKKAPVFLTNGRGVITDATVKAMRNAGVTRAVIAGGERAVSPRTVTKLQQAGIKVVRKWGATAVGTSSSFALWALGQGMTANKMGVATVNGYWDALTGAALCGRNNAVLVLASNRDASAITQVARANRSQITKAYVFGGTAAVSQDTYNRAVASTR